MNVAGDGKWKINGRSGGNKVRNGRVKVGEDGRETVR